jgi:Phosphoribosyl transferase domain
MTKIIDSNRIVTLVDDGAASGSTLIAAARWIKNRKAHKFKKLIIAIVLAFTSVFLTTGSPFQIASDLTETNGYLNHKNIGEAFAEDGEGGGGGGDDGGDDGGDLWEGSMVAYYRVVEDLEGLLK